MTNIFWTKLVNSCVRGGHLCTKEERKERCYQNPVDSRRVFVGGHCTRQVQCSKYNVQMYILMYYIQSIKLNCYATHILLCYFTMPIFIVKLKTGAVKLDGTKVIIPWMDCWRCVLTLFCFQLHSSLHY